MTEAVEGEAVEARAVVRRCVDCGELTKRPAPYPGPRCATHHREKRKRDKERQADAKMLKTYGLTPEDYQDLLASQNGRCALCHRRIGVSRRAAIDHDHGCGKCGGSGCRFCVRGLVDGLCNKDVLGRFGDDPDRFRAIVDYLERPPAQRVLNRTSTV